MHLIFGSSGFIGSNLVKFISKKYGNNKVIRISKSKSIKKKKKNYYKINLKNKDRLINLKFEKIDTAYICAGNPKTFVKNKFEGKIQIDENRKIIKNIILFCKKNKVKKLIFLSSSAVYNKKNKYPLSENQEINPKTFLGYAKKINEKQLKRFSQNSNTKVLILRIFTVYGKGMRKDQFIHQLRNKIRNNKQVLLWNKETFRNFILIDDLVRIIDILANKTKKKYNIINVGTNKSFKIKYIYEKLSKIINKKRKLYFASNNNNFDHFVKISKLKNEIKNFKFTNIVDGLKECIKYAKSIILIK